MLGSRSAICVGHRESVSMFAIGETKRVNTAALITGGSEFKSTG
jgi:hypothetical protein